MRGEKGLEKVPQVKGHPLLSWTPAEKKLLSKIHGSDIFKGPIHLIKSLRIGEARPLTRKRVGIAGKNYADRLLHYYLAKK